MANKVQITVSVNGAAAIAQMASISAATKAATDNQKSAWSTLGTHVGNVFKGLGGLAAGALGVGLTGPLAAAGLALGAFAAVAAPTLDKVDKALTSTGKSGQKAWADLDPAQRNLATSIKGLEGTFGDLTTKLEPVVTGVLNLATHTAGDLLPAVGNLAGAGAKVISDFLTPLNSLLSSKFFADFVTQMSNLATQVGPVLGSTLTGLLKVFMQLFEQAGPAAVQILQALLPAIVNIASGLVPVISGITQVVALIINWLAKNNLLIPALIAVGAAMTIAGGPISVLIAGVALVVGGLVHLWETSQTFRQIVTDVFSVVGQSVLTFVEVFLTGMQTVVNIFLTAVGTIVHGAADAFGWVPGVGGKLKSAAKAFDGFQSDVNNVFNAAHAKIEGWKTDLANMPKKVALQGDITDLTNKLNSAKKELADPNLTATKRAQIQANIDQLTRQIADAKAQLASINGQTATTYIRTVFEQVNPKNQSLPGGYPGGSGAASGGIIPHRAEGGPGGSYTLVGEHGPELVRLPGGSTVHSNPDTQRMLSQGGGTLAVQLEVLPGGASAFEQFMVTAIREWVRVKGSGNVQQAFGRS